MGKKVYDLVNRVHEDAEDEMPKEMTDKQRDCICYKSKLLNKYFDSYDALVEAEEEYKAEKAEKNKLATERKERAEEVQRARARILEVRKEARKMIADADEEYRKLLNKFIEDYGSYHDTYEETTADGWIKSIFDIFRL